MDYFFEGVSTGDLDTMKTLPFVVIHCEMLIYIAKVIFLYMLIFFTDMLVAFMVASVQRYRLIEKAPASIQELGAVRAGVEVEIKTLKEKL